MLAASCGLRGLVAAAAPAGSGARTGDIDPVGTAGSGSVGAAEK